MKKALSILLAASMTAVLLSGCAAQKSETQKVETQESISKESGTSQTQEPEVDPVQNLIDATQGTVSLNFWCDESPAYQEVMKTIVDNFKATYPSVTFDITIGAESVVDCREDVLADPESAADIFVFADDQLPDLVKAGALQPVSATFTYNPADACAASTIEAASMNEQLYAYPMTASNGFFLFYDKNVLTEDDVKSWDSLLAAADKAGKKVGMEVSGAWSMVFIRLLCRCRA